MATGQVLRYEPGKGYGFIKPDGGGADVFMHVSQLARGEDPDRLRKGVMVGFLVVEDSRGCKAAQVKILDGPVDPDDELADVLTSGEFNEAVHGLIAEQALAFRQKLTEFAQARGWVA